MQILPIWFIYVAAAMRILGGLAYVRATLSKQASPHAVSWLLWAITPLVTFVAEVTVGVGLIAIVTLAMGVSPILVVLAALKTDRRLFRLDSFDAVCIGIALIGLLIWAITRQPITAIILAIAADTISCLPTIRKTYRRPDSEYPPTFLLSASSMALALLASREITFAGFAFPTYVLIMNLIILSLSMRRYFIKKRPPAKRAYRSKARVSRRRKLA